MEPLLLVSLGLLLLLLVALTPVMRERYGEKYEDERAFLREQRPRAWGLVGDISRGEESTAGERAPGLCPLCGTENGTEYTYCRNCNSRLPAREE